MNGIQTACKDNTRLGRQGCGATYRGRQVHCTIAADWSTHPDGRCHETFAAYSTFDLHANPAAGEHLDPRAMDDKLRQDERGVWHQWNPNRPNRWAEPTTDD